MLEYKGVKSDEMDVENNLWWPTPQTPRYVNARRTRDGRDLNACKRLRGPTQSHSLLLLVVVPLLDWGTGKSESDVLR